jgi:hypothetical protein
MEIKVRKRWRKKLGIKLMGCRARHGQTFLVERKNYADIIRMTYTDKDLTNLLKVFFTIQTSIYGQIL